MFQTPHLFRLAAIEAQAVAPDDGCQGSRDGIALGDPIGRHVAVKGIASETFWVKKMGDGWEVEATSEILE